MNKLDSFNKDKIKCPKCKEYYDEISVVSEPKVFIIDSISSSNALMLCDGCYAKWIADDESPIIEDWCNNEQT